MKILFITLSNIGDVLLSLPVLDSLLAVYPRAEVTVVCGGRPAELFKDNFYIRRCIVQGQRKNIFARIKFLRELKIAEYDLVIDLKNSALPFFLKAQHKTYPWFNAPPKVVHMKDRHLFKVKKFVMPLYIKAGLEKNSKKDGGLLIRKSLYISDQDRRTMSHLLDEAFVSFGERVAVVACGSRSHIKRWPAEKFAGLCDKLRQELKLKIILVGDEDDRKVCGAVKEKAVEPVIDFSGKTTLNVLASLMERADLVISCDSAALHLASYLDRPIVAIFGPTDEKKYGPWSSCSYAVKSPLDCSPCETAQCKTDNLDCMNKIEVEEVYSAAKSCLMLGNDIVL